MSQIICTKRQKRSPWAAPLVYLSTYRISTPTGRMGHTLQLYIVHRMKALPKIPPLAGLDNFFRCGAGALARESFWVAQRFQRCDSMYVTEHSISPLSFRTGFSREESAFPSLRIPPFLILADALLSLRQTDSLTTPAPFRGGITIAQHISAGSATDRDPFFELHSVVLKSIAELDV